MTEMMRSVLITFFISGNDVISLELRPLNFRIIILLYTRIACVWPPAIANTRTKSIHKQIIKYNIKSTVDKFKEEVKNL